VAAAAVVVAAAARVAVVVLGEPEPVPVLRPQEAAVPWDHQMRVRRERAAPL
jgi:hypothetical protein